MILPVRLNNQTIKIHFIIQLLAFGILEKKNGVKHRLLLIIVRSFHAFEFVIIFPTWIFTLIKKLRDNILPVLHNLINFCVFAAAIDFLNINRADIFFDLFKNILIRVITIHIFFLVMVQFLCAADSFPPKFIKRQMLNYDLIYIF